MASNLYFFITTHYNFFFRINVPIIIIIKTVKSSNRDNITLFRRFEITYINYLTTMIL